MPPPGPATPLTLVEASIAGLEALVAEAHRLADDLSEAELPSGAATSLLAELRDAGLEIDSGEEDTYRLLAGVLIHSPTELRALRERTIAPLELYDADARDAVGRDARKLPRSPRLNHRHRRGHGAASPHGRLPTDPDPGGLGALALRVRGSRAAEPGPQSQADPARRSAPSRAAGAVHPSRQSGRRPGLASKRAASAGRWASRTQPPRGQLQTNTDSGRACRGLRRGRRGRRPGCR